MENFAWKWNINSESATMAIFLFNVKCTLNSWNNLMNTSLVTVWNELPESTKQNKVSLPWKSKKFSLLFLFIPCQFFRFSFNFLHLSFFPENSFQSQFFSVSFYQTMKIKKINEGIRSFGICKILMWHNLNKGNTFSTTKNAHFLFSFSEEKFSTSD